MSPRRLWAIAGKEWTHVRRDPRSLGVALLLPILLLLLMGAGVNFDLQDLPFAVCDFDNSSHSRRLVNELAYSPPFRLVGRVPNPQAGEKMLRQGDCLVLLVIPPNMGRDLQQGATVDLQILVDGSDSNTAGTARTYIEGALAQHSRYLLAERAEQVGLPAQQVGPGIQVQRKVLYNPALESRNFIVPGLIVVILVIMGALLTSGAIVRERERGSFEALAASPALAVEIIVGKALPYLALGVVDILLAVTVGAVVFGVHIAGSGALLLALGAIFMLCALATGLLFSAVSRTQQVAMIGAFIATFLPSMLLSGFVFPILSMPLVLRLISNIIPATHFLVITRGIYLKAVGLSVLWPPLLVLIVLTATVITLSVVGFRKRL